MDRYPNSRPPCHEVTKLFHEEQLEAYEPYGVEGPKVDLLSSISLVNRYHAITLKPLCTTLLMDII